MKPVLWTMSQPLENHAASVLSDAIAEDRANFALEVSNARVFCQASPVHPRAIAKLRIGMLPHFRFLVDLSQAATSCFPLA